MGSGISKDSKQLVCPNSYQKNDFDKILRLFDRLDEDGDQIVDNNELKYIARLHINNNIRLFDMNLANNKIIFESNNKKFLEKKKLQILNLEKEWDARIVEYQKEYKREMNSANIKLVKYKTMEDKEKQQIFMDIITNDNKKLDFWKFFDYLKDKIEDIGNIKFN